MNVDQSSRAQAASADSTALCSASRSARIGSFVSVPAPRVKRTLPDVPVLPDAPPRPPPDNGADPNQVRVTPRAGAVTRHRTTSSSPSRVRSRTSQRQSAPSFSSSARSAGERAAGGEARVDSVRAAAEALADGRAVVREVGESAGEPEPLDSASSSRRLRSSISSNADEKPLNRSEGMMSPVYRAGALFHQRWNSSPAVAPSPPLWPSPRR